MQANLKALTAASIQKCRENGLQCEPVELAYLACLLEEQQAWAQRASAAAEAAPSTSGSTAAGAGDQAVCQPQEQQQQQPLRFCVASRLAEPALAAMVERLHQELGQPVDPAAAATAHLQVALERTFKQQQDAVEAEQPQQAGDTARLASAVAYKKVNLQAAGLPLYQSVFSQIVGYVCAAAGFEPKTSSDPEARAQVSAAVESVLPLSSLAYFLTLPAQERMQQLESVAAISCGICLFNSHTGNAPSPLSLSADTQLLQAQRLLADIQAAAAQAEAALDHHNRPLQHTCPAASPVLTAAAAYFLGSSSGSTGAASCSSSGSSNVQLGAALFCCHAVVALRALLVDLTAGISCCRQLHSELLAALTQAAQLTEEALGSAVLKEAVFPLFESAGRMYHALKGELRLLLVRGRLWEATCERLTAASQQPAVPQVLGFAPRRRQGLTERSCSTHGTHSTAGSRMAAAAATGSSPGSMTGVEDDAAAAVIDLASLPADMEFVPAGGCGATCAAGDGCNAEGPEPSVLALSGMCPVSVACSVAAGAAAAGVPEGPHKAEQETDRLLVGQLVRPESGMIRYAGKLYGFSSPSALAAFVAGPEIILDAVRQAAHHAPTLLHSLGLSAPDTAAATAAAARPQSASRPHSGHPSSAPYGTRSSGSSPTNDGSAAGSPVYRGSSAGASRSSVGGVLCWRMPPLRGLLELFGTPLKVEAGTQTVTHVVERLVDVDYEWNEWALRRRIIALANLRLKSTHSTQTLISSFRRSGSSQTWLPKQAATQTKANKGSSVPKKLRYVTGLRGAPDSKMKVVALELDVHGKGATVKHRHI